MSTIDNTQNGSLFANMQAKANANSTTKEDLGSWFEAMADAWGNALDDQAGRITELSDAVTSGSDSPSTVTLLTAESLRMQFLSNNAATSTSSVGKALESLARKQ